MMQEEQEALENCECEKQRVNASTRAGRGYA